jgi:hypothetical protein
MRLVVVLVRQRQAGSPPWLISGNISGKQKQAAFWISRLKCQDKDLTPSVTQNSENSRLPIVTCKKLGITERPSRCFTLSFNSSPPLAQLLQALCVLRHEAQGCAQGLR